MPTVYSGVLTLPEFIERYSSSGRSGVRQLEVRVGGEQAGQVGVAVLPGEAEAEVPSVVGGVTCNGGGSSCSSPCRTRTPASRRRRHSPPLGNKAIVSRQTRRYFLFFRSYMLREREPRFKKERDCFSKCV